MRKDILACTITVTMTLCLSTFLITDGTAEEVMKGNVVESDLSTVAMHDAALSFTAPSAPAPDRSTDGKDENILILVRDPKHPCNEAYCNGVAPAPGAKAVDGSACTSGLVCSQPGYPCMANTGNCTTVQLGGGKCACPCVPQ